MAEYMAKVLRRKGFDPLTAILKFGKGNSKLEDIPTISLPAGYSCPFAKDCRSCATRKPVGKKKKTRFIIQDGPNTQFRCSTAIDEALRPVVREARWHNLLALQVATRQGLEATIALIEQSLPPKSKWGVPTRIHVSGDFFNQVYFDAWLEVVRRHADRKFYAYTKALPYWVRRIDKIPRNLKLIASYGGTHDYLIERFGLRSAIVVKSVEEAKALRLSIDHDDSLAYGTDKSFALLVHGQQPEGIWAKAWFALKKLGLAGYGKQKAGTVRANV